MSMKDMNIAKLSSVDLPLFNGIIQDLFPAVETPAIDYGKVACPVAFIWPHNGLTKQPKVCVYLCVNVCSWLTALKSIYFLCFWLHPSYFSVNSSHTGSLSLKHLSKDPLKPADIFLPCLHTIHTVHFFNTNKGQCKGISGSLVDNILRSTQKVAVLKPRQSNLWAGELQISQFNFVPLKCVVCNVCANNSNSGHP